MLETPIDTEVQYYIENMEGEVCYDFGSLRDVREIKRKFETLQKTVPDRTYRLVKVVKTSYYLE